MPVNHASRISLRFLRGLKNKRSMLKKIVFKRILSILIPKSSKLHCYVKKVRKLYNTRHKCNQNHDPKIFYLIKATVSKKTYLLSFSSQLYHMTMKLKCKACRYLSLFSCNSESHMTNYLNFKLSTDMLLLSSLTLSALKQKIKLSSMTWLTEWQSEYAFQHQTPTEPQAANIKVLDVLNTS